MGSGRRQGEDQGGRAGQGGEAVHAGVFPDVHSVFKTPGLECRATRSCSCATRTRERERPRQVSDEALRHSSPRGSLLPVRAPQDCDVMVDARGREGSTHARGADREA